MSARFLPPGRRASIATCVALVLAACSGPQPRAPGRPVPAEVIESPEPAQSAVPEMDVPVSPPTAVSTWERLRQRFVLSGCNDSDTVLKQAQHLTAAPDRFSLAWQQAMPFLQIVVDEIERRGLPGEIALLPYVESRYQQLPGKAGGPAGMWQLMAPTARGHGVHVSATYDGRLDPFESTRAALDLIERLDREFADWRLASMAYNAGEYRIKRALRGRPTTALTPASLAKLQVNPVTHQFLERVLALSCIVKDPDRFKVRLPPVAPEDTLEAINLDAPVDFNLAARLANVAIDDLRRYNAASLAGSFSAAAPPKLILPKRAIEKFVSAISRIPEKKRMHWKVLRIDADTTLQALAGLHEIPVEALAVANGASDDSEVDAGRILLVPGCDPVSCAGPDVKTHEIRSGDTLSAIARRYGVRVAELMQWNTLRKDSTLRTGMRLHVRAPGY